MTSKGHHRRKVWTARALRRMLQDGHAGEEGPRPYFAIILPGACGSVPRPADLRDEVDIGRDARAKQALIDAIGFVSPPNDRSDWVGDTPKRLKYLWFGVWRGRWCISGCLTSRAQRHGYPGELPELAAFINRIQYVIGSCVTVYGRPNPIDRWVGDRYFKMMLDHLYFSLPLRYPRRTAQEPA